MFTDKLKIYLFALAISLQYIVGIAQNNAVSHETSSNTGRSVLRTVSNSSDRKRLPSNIYIEIIYRDGYVILKSSQEELVLDLTFKNCLTGSTTVIPTIEIGESLPVELDAGQYELTANRIDGKIFYGVMIIDSL